MARKIKVQAGAMVLNVDSRHRKRPGKMARELR